MSETATTIEVPAAKKKLWDGFAKDLFWFVENQKNVYIAGEHGTGKTHVILDMVKTMGYSYKYFSCATMDPWTSFVGVPVPTDLDSAGVPQHLKLVRPQEIGNVDVLIFDEFNRVRDETVHAAVMELVQFGTINEEPMNVKFVIAMVNFNALYNPTIQVTFWGLLGIGLGIVTHFNTRRPTFNVVYRFGQGE